MPASTGANTSTLKAACSGAPSLAHWAWDCLVFSDLGDLQMLTKACTPVLLYVTGKACLRMSGAHKTHALPSVRFKQAHQRQALCTFWLRALQRESRGACSDGHACHRDACIACSGSCLQLCSVLAVQVLQRDAHCNIPSWRRPVGRQVVIGGKCLPPTIEPWTSVS